MLLFVRKKIKLIAHSLHEPSLMFIIGMREILAENSTELISEQRSVSDLCRCYARSTKIARIYLNIYISWSKGNFRQKSSVLCIILWAKTVRFGATNDLFLWMWICSSCSQTQLRKTNWQSWVWPRQPLEKLPSSISRTPRAIWGRQAFFCQTLQEPCTPFWKMEAKN